MKAKKIRIQLQGTKSVLDEFVSNAETLSRSKSKPLRKSKTDNDFVLCFDDLTTFAKIFSPERLRLLRAVREHKPSSLNELARILEREYPNVYNDARFLADQGVLELTETGEGRGRGKIRPSFDWDGFDIAV